MVASVGHIRDLPTKEMAVDLQTFETTYQLTERGAPVVNRDEREWIVTPQGLVRDEFIEDVGGENLGERAGL